MRFALLVVATGCWTGTPPAPPPVRARAASGLVMTQSGVGPIDATTPTTLLGLRALLPTYRVVPLNDPALEYDVFDRREKLLFIVLKDNGAHVFNIHATSNKVTISDRSWRVGVAFTDAKQLTHCECWGSNPTCYRAGDHIAVNFDRTCLESDSELGELDGLAPQRVIWSPEPFGTPGED